MPESLVGALSVRAFEPPLSERRWNGQIGDVSDPVNVGLLIVEFETEVMMNGIADAIGNHTGTYAPAIVEALVAIGCTQQAGLLSQILEVATAAGMTHESIQADRAALSEYTVTSFRELHGDKWRAALDRVHELADQIDFEEAMAALEKFAEAHREAFESVLRS